MARRKINDAHEARTLLEQQRSSGMTQAGFARSRGIDGRSLNAWRLNLARSPARPAGLQFLELVTADPVARPSLTVRCGPFVVEVPSQFDQDELARRIQSLQISDIVTSPGDIRAGGARGYTRSQEVVCRPRRC